MNRVALGLLGAAALSVGTGANATLTIGAPIGLIGTTGTTSGTLTFANVNNPVDQLKFDTTATVASTVTSFFDFQESMASTGYFTVTNASGSVTLEQLINGAMITLVSSAGSGPFLSLQTGLLAANTTYRFSYTSVFPLAAGGNASGNAVFSAVPEPATWALMLLGFGGMGVAMRRSRKRVIAQIA